MRIFILIMETINGKQVMRISSRIFKTYRGYCVCDRQSAW